MAYPRTRSVNRELEAGATDGKYKKIVADRGGDVERTFLEDRAELIGAFYGITEHDSMRVPGMNRTCANPYRASVPAPDPAYF